MKGRRHTQPKPVASGSIFFSCLHPLAIVNDHPLHSSLSLIHLKSILQVGFSMKSIVSFSPSCTNQGRCISENSSLDVGCSFPFCFSVLTFHVIKGTSSTRLSFRRLLWCVAFSKSPANSPALLILGAITAPVLFIFVVASPHSSSKAQFCCLSDGVNK